ncbi:hypothetical protein Wcon_00734 [Wolbachia endosymbiont of Cylisticus convexus]|uniref:hypothetical protein n=1 Tax=Wolbachia endosymbiont of Cylisticus convexus TaxID=118728 RepID=UPI000DF71E76|nr:hypothetical protein [Wolbachia endosymbiont of Cylisticus convexus]RDD35150.1 hypothetical protein Wcon_00734 [Wolbachia endosymbiont of Cylisticus convexus]
MVKNQDKKVINTVSKFGLGVTIALMTIVVTTTAAIEPLVDKRYYWLVEVIVLSPLFELGVLNKP